jgi:hypothetical protein
VGGFDGPFEGGDRGLVVATLLLGATQVGQMVSLGRGEPQLVRRVGGPSQVGGRVREAVLGLRETAQHRFDVVQRPLIAERTEKAQRLIAGRSAPSRRTEGDLGPGAQQPTGTLFPLTAETAEIGPAISEQDQGILCPALLAADERQVQPAHAAHLVVADPHRRSDHRSSINRSARTSTPASRASRTSTSVVFPAGMTRRAPSRRSSTGPSTAMVSTFRA